MPAKTQPITIHVSTKMLREIDRLGSVSRERFVMDAIEAYLALCTEPMKPDVTKPPKFTKAISEGTGGIKTGRYEP
jgi:hypothetical protein